MADPPFLWGVMRPAGSGWVEPDVDTLGTGRAQGSRSGSGLRVEYGAVMWGAQRRIKLGGPLFNICPGFQGGNRGALDPVQGLLSSGGTRRPQLWGCQGRPP